MTFLQIINLIKDTALAQPNVNTFVRNFLDLNREDTVYSAVVLQDRDGNRDRISEQDWNTYSFHLGYVDRLTDDESNRDDIFSTGINIINNIVASIRDTWFPDVEVNIIDRFQTFDQRFTASCAGVYVVLAIQVPVSDCVDSEQTDLYDQYEATFTENGHYHFVPSGRPIDEIDITIDVDSAKPEERLVETIKNVGSYHFDPTPGSVFSSADIDVDIENIVKYDVDNLITGFDNSPDVLERPLEDDVTKKLLLSYEIKDDNNLEGISVEGNQAGISNYSIENDGGVQILKETFDPFFTYSDAIYFASNMLGNVLIYKTTNGSEISKGFMYSEPDDFISVSTNMYLSKFNVGFLLFNTDVLTYIYTECFRSCSNLEEIYLPARIRTLKRQCFVGCSNLKKIEIQDPTVKFDNYNKGLDTIYGYRTFSNCTSLEKIVLPSSLSTINNYDRYILSEPNTVFYGCTNLKEVVIKATTPPSFYYGPNGIPEDADYSRLFANCHPDLQIKVPAGSVDAYKSAEGWRYWADKIVSQ